MKVKGLKCRVKKVKDTEIRKRLREKFKSNEKFSLNIIYICNSVKQCRTYQNVRDNQVDTHFVTIYKKKYTEDEE